MSGFVIPVRSAKAAIIGEALGIVADRERNRILDREAAMRAVKRGDTYGHPAALVESCRAELQAEEDALSLAPVTRISPTQVIA